MRPSLRIFLLVVLATGLSACDGDDNPAGQGDNMPANGTLTATIDGNSWSAAQIVAVNNNGFVAISGSDTALLATGFAFMGSAPGTYPIGPSSSASANVIENSTTTWTANSFQGSGSITVTALSATGATGTFSYTVPRTIGTGTPETRVVTNGTFNVTF